MKKIIHVTIIIAIAITIVYFNSNISEFFLFDLEKSIIFIISILAICTAVVFSSKSIFQGYEKKILGELDLIKDLKKTKKNINFNIIRILIALFLIFVYALLKDIEPIIYFKSTRILNIVNSSFVLSSILYVLASFIDIIIPVLILYNNE